MTNTTQLTNALQGLLDRYLELVNSGDAGNWNPEKEPQVIAARVALGKKPTITEQHTLLKEYIATIMGVASSYVTLDHVEPSLVFFRCGPVGQVVQWTIKTKKDGTPRAKTLRRDLA